MGGGRKPQAVAAFGWFGRASCNFRWAKEIQCESAEQASLRQLMNNSQIAVAQTLLFEIDSAEIRVLTQEDRLSVRAEINARQGSSFSEVLGTVVPGKSDRLRAMPPASVSAFRMVARIPASVLAGLPQKIRREDTHPMDVVAMGALAGDSVESLAGTMTVWCDYPERLLSAVRSVFPDISRFTVQHPVFGNIPLKFSTTVNSEGTEESRLRTIVTGPQTAPDEIEDLSGTAEEKQPVPRHALIEFQANRATIGALTQHWFPVTRSLGGDDQVSITPVVELGGQVMLGPKGANLELHCTKALAWDIFGALIVER